MFISRTIICDIEETWRCYESLTLLAFAAGLVLVLFRFFSLYGFALKSLSELPDYVASPVELAKFIAADVDALSQWFAVRSGRGGRVWIEPVIA